MKGMSLIISPNRPEIAVSAKNAITVVRVAEITGEALAPGQRQMQGALARHIIPGPRVHHPPERAVAEEERVEVPGRGELALLLMEVRDIRQGRDVESEGDGVQPHEQNEGERHQPEQPRPEAAKRRRLDARLRTGSR